MRRGTEVNLIDKPEISSVISKYSTLRPVGKNLRGTCPFHAERNPSFFVRPYSQSYICYGCGARGDVIEFVMRMESVNFLEACKRLGIELKPKGKTRQELKKKELIKKFKTWCESYYDDLCSLYRTLQVAKDKAKTIEDVEALADFYHMESLWLYHIEILQGNNEEAKLELYREVIHEN
ncbi:MAG: hypothetical protein FJ241_03815 [Nitrospira sp.]|nr:hypothetical protein [Nitrospira sp.]